MAVIWLNIKPHSYRHRWVDDNYDKIDNIIEVLHSENCHNCLSCQRQLGELILFLNVCVA